MTESFQPFKRYMQIYYFYTYVLLQSKNLKSNLNLTKLKWCECTLKWSSQCNAMLGIDISFENESIWKFPPEKFTHSMNMNKFLIHKMKRERERHGTIKKYRSLGLFAKVKTNQ